MPRTKPEPTEDDLLAELEQLMLGTSGAPVIAFFDRHPELAMVPFHVCNALRPDVLAKQVSRLRALAIDPAAPRSESREAVRLLKLTGYDDASLGAEEPEPVGPATDD